MKENNNVSNAVVYIPPNTILNFGNDEANPPKTKYDRHRATFHRDAVNKVVKGKYGADGNDFK